MTALLVPAEPTRVEIRVANSRFIATLAPAFTVEEARSFIAQVREEFADASHNVPAFIIGHGASVISHSSDDGEPSGTAGRPALAVLQGSGLGDVVVVITRYFGGTKLGTGGLVRAYGDAVRAVLEGTPLAQKVATHMIMFVVPYGLFEPARLLVAEYGGLILDETFAAEVTLTARFSVNGLPPFEAALQDLTRGKGELVLVESNETTLMPLSS
ncbi:MAG: IMPACT family protein [Anaerolineales bacterium]